VLSHSRHRARFTLTVVMAGRCCVTTHEAASLRFDILVVGFVLTTVKMLNLQYGQINIFKATHINGRHVVSIRINRLAKWMDAARRAKMMFYDAFIKQVRTHHFRWCMQRHGRSWNKPHERSLSLAY
jgi:hypothetical protein